MVPHYYSRGTPLPYLLERSSTQQLGLGLVKLAIPFSICKSDSNLNYVL